MLRKRTVKLSEAFRSNQIVSPVILGLLFTAALFPNAVQGIVCNSELQCTESGCNITANNTQYCTECPDGSGLLYDPPNPTRCTDCGSRCASCKVIGQVCPRCVDTFGPIFSGSGKGSCGACVSVAANCVGGCNVNGAGRCDNCDNGFGLTNGNTSCTACVLNCLVCDTSISYCDQCKATFYLYPQNRTCGRCADHCTQYKCSLNGAGKCDQCDNGYGLTATKTCEPCASNCIVYGCAVNGAGKCDHCDLGYSLTSTNTCAPCSPNCNASIGCDSPNTCITCNLSYGRLPNGTCDVCASNCTTNGCAVNGAMKCDRCDLGFNLTSTKTCTPTSAVQTTSGISAGADGSQTLSRNFTSASDWTSAMTTWIMPSGDTTTCPMLAIGLGLGVPCGFIIIVLLIIITVLCIQNRSLGEYKKQSQDSKQSHTINSRASNITLQPPLTPYQQLKMQSTQREYEPIDRYDTISTAETENTGHYETPIN